MFAHWLRIKIVFFLHNKEVNDIDIDVDSFMMVGGLYVKDKYSSFFLGSNNIHRLDADVSSFKVFSHRIAKDKNNYYENGELIIKI